MRRWRSRRVHDWTWVPALSCRRLNLIADTAPVAWGAIGTPVQTLAAVSALPESDLNAMIGRILPFTAIIVPFWLVCTMVSWKETVEAIPAILVVGVSFGLQFRLVELCG